MERLASSRELQKQAIIRPNLGGWLMTLLTARIAKISLTIWFITWFIIDNQIGYLLTAPYIVAMMSLPSKVAR
jgi:hypothetical protein